MTSSRGRQMIPREMITVAGPAGGWLTSNRTMQAPVAAIERAIARIRGRRYTVFSERQRSSARAKESPITADEPDGVTENSVSQAGGFFKSGEKNSTLRPEYTGASGRADPYRFRQEGRAISSISTVLEWLAGKVQRASPRPPLTGLLHR